MEIIQVVGIGIVAAILAVTVKEQSPQMGILITICSCLLIFFMVLPKLAAVLQVFERLKVSADASYISVILKIVGIAYIAEFGAQICIDAGETAIASKIDLAGKVLIMVMSAPILLGLLDLISRAMP